MNILNIEHIHKIFGDKVIFDDISCGIDQGEKILRSVINYVRDKKDNYGSVHIIYGSRSADDLVDYQEILNEWQTDENV